MILASCLSQFRLISSLKRGCDHIRHIQAIKIEHEKILIIIILHMKLSQPLKTFRVHKVITMCFFDRWKALEEFEFFLHLVFHAIQAWHKNHKNYRLLLYEEAWLMLRTHLFFLLLTHKTVRRKKGKEAKNPTTFSSSSLWISYKLFSEAAWFE